MATWGSEQAINDEGQPSQIATRAEFDTARKVWKIPAERMKAKREHEVPLSDAAIALLESMPKVIDVVFAGTKGQPLSDMSLTSVIRRMNDGNKPVWVDANGERVTVHGFRSSFRMWAAEATNYPREVAEHALAHQLPLSVPISAVCSLPSVLL